MNEVAIGSCFFKGYGVSLIGTTCVQLTLTVAGNHTIACDACTWRLGNRSFSLWLVDFGGILRVRLEKEREGKKEN